MDGFLRSGDNDEFAISFYREADLPFIPSAARAFTAFDRFFCSILASTYPNREYMHAAQSYGKVDNSTPSAGFQDQGFADTTIFASLAAKGIEARYYYNDLPVSALWGAKGLSRSARIEEYYQRASSGTLAPLSFVDPSFANEGGGTSGDEHPHGDVRVGQAFMSDVVHAFMALAAVEARRALHRLRRVGRVLRPRAAAARARHPRAATPTRTTARWASGSPRSPCRRTCGGATSGTRSTASSRSSR